MGFFSDIFSSKIVEVISTTGAVVDKFITSDQERMEAKAELTNIITSFATGITEAQAEVIKLELAGNWLQRSWRPILMLAFGFIIIYRYFLAPTFGWPQAELPDRFWNLLEIGMGGYVIGRSVEKVASTVSENFNTIPTKKRRRK